jgi:hypothetical protein
MLKISTVSHGTGSEGTTQGENAGAIGIHPASENPLET